MTTLKTIIKRVMGAGAMILVLSILVFCMARMAPGDPLRAYYGDHAEKMNEEQIIAAQKNLGLDQPIYIQYIKWIERAVHGDLGISFQYKQNVSTVIGSMIGNTLILGGLSYVLTFIFAVLLGIFCALHEDKLLDRIICRIGTIIHCIPAFCISLFLLMIFSVNLGLLPSSGAYGLGQSKEWASRLEHLILPLSVMIISHLWYYAYMIRNKLVEETRKEYVRLAKAKGLNKYQIVSKHCLANTMPVIISLMAVSVPHILTGTYVIEKVFSYPGIGTLAFESAKYHDYNMLMVICLMTGILVILSSNLADMINKRIDPRTAGGKAGI